MTKDYPLVKGDVVQLADTHPWAGALMIVTEPKSFGCQGFVPIPESNTGEKPCAQAFNRVKWADMEYVGKATFLPVDAMMDEE